MRLKNKRIFITAAAQGIGKAISEAFVKEGAELYASDINFELISSLEAHEKIKLDVCDFSKLQNVIKKIKPEVLINCAGYVHSGTILNTSVKDIDFSLDLNVKSMFIASQAAIPSMIKNKKGSIVNISSVVSSIIGTKNRFVYGTTKAAIIGLTKSIAADFITEGLRCNCICPATVDTPSLHERLKETGDYEKAKKDFINRQKMGRIGDPREIASLAVYLASDESTFTTGQEHIIDGGWTLG